jgi:hypothetical protein
MKNPEKEARYKWSVSIHSGGLSVQLWFKTETDAKQFAMMSISSPSVEGVSIYRDGKFMGARDGAGS